MYTRPKAIAFGMISIALLLLACEALNPSHAADTPYIPVGPSKSKKTTLAFAPIQVFGGTEGAALSREIAQTFQNDLLFTDQFQFLAPSTFIEDPKQAGLTPDRFKFSEWKTIGTEFLIKAGFTQIGKNTTLEGYLYDPNTAQQLLARRYVGTTDRVKTLAHQFANDVVERLTGQKGIFLTKIAMTCDRSGKKEIYIMNFDGSNVREVTHHRSTAIAPAWSPDGTRLSYSLYNRHANNVRNLDLFEYNFISHTIRLLSNRVGLNSGSAYSPDGSRIALTMSFLGNPEIFLLDVANKNVVRLTQSFGFDVDPAWSPNGKEIAFVSSRSGKPMVYKMFSDGSNVQRLTYAGTYNATPSWSPMGNKIAFAGWLDRQFDIFIMNADGTKIERLTKSQGNNEDPFFSPDGSFLVFSSNRTGTKNIYVMNTSGTSLKRLTYGLGNCVAPHWSSPIQAYP